MGALTYGPHTSRALVMVLDMQPGSPRGRVSPYCARHCLGRLMPKWRPTRIGLPSLTDGILGSLRSLEVKQEGRAGYTAPVPGSCVRLSQGQLPLMDGSENRLPAPARQAVIHPGALQRPRW